MIDVASPQLNDLQQRMLDSLRADGIATVQFQELFGEELWQQALADIEPFVERTAEATRDLGDQPEAKEDVIIRRFEQKRGKRPTLALDSPWIRYAASPLILDVVNAYGGETRRVFQLDNWFTPPYPGADARVASQRWHRDGEDEHVIKAFVYFVDVDEETGPFEYVRQSTTGATHGNLWAWETDLRYPPQDEFEQKVPQEDRLTLTGPAGTMIVCDTGGFHRGGFARSKPRVLSISTYIPLEARKGKRRFKVDYGGGEAALPPQVRAALP